MPKPNHTAVQEDRAMLFRLAMVGAAIGLLMAVFI